MLRRLFTQDGPLPPILLPLGGALLALAVARGSAHAETVAPAAESKTYTFFIAQNDGYGLSDCLTSTRACGRVVADSWCSAHGYGAATAWGRTDDMTASTGTPAIKAPPKGQIAVTCSE
ncbi:MAG: hypothetical protein AB7F96_03245 [Beijerinckiaceae bacterium]